MGAWGVGPFDNDGAGDLLAALRQGDFDVDWAFADEEYLEVDGGQIAVALAQLVVDVRDGIDVPDIDLEALRPEFTADRVAWIRAQLSRTLSGPEQSELFELWAETAEFDAWFDHAKELLAELS